MGSAAGNANNKDVDVAAAAAKTGDGGANGANGDGAHGAHGDGGGSAIAGDVSYRGIARQFSLLGWTAFGGPAAHIGIMQRVRACGLCGGGSWWWWWRRRRRRVVAPAFSGVASIQMHTTTHTHTHTHPNPAPTNSASCPSCAG